MDPEAAPFEPIPNSFRFWAADPFLFEYKRTGKETEIYIFAELYDYLHGKGTIGYCKRKADGSFTKWKQVIREPWHLSFPNIHAVDGEIYMVPESYQNNELYVYRAVAFPDKWEKCHVLSKNIVCADTVFLRDHHEEFGITLRMNRKEHVNCMQVFSIVDGSAVNFRTITSDMLFARNAGKIIFDGEKRYRVFQDCTGSYGKRIGFAEIEQISNETYTEKIVRYVGVEDIKIRGNRPQSIQGMHTYNCTEKYECVDWKFDDRSVLGVLLNVLKSVYRKTREIMQ